jgi:hypothetical protein
MIKYNPAARAYNQGGVLDVPGGELVSSVLLLDVVQQVKEVSVAPNAPTGPVERLRKKGVDVGLINKSTVNEVDEHVIKDIGSTGFVLVV